MVVHKPWSLIFGFELSDAAVGTIQLFSCPVYYALVFLPLLAMMRRMAQSPHRELAWRARLSAYLQECRRPLQVQVWLLVPQLAFLLAMLLVMVLGGGGGD